MRLETNERKIGLTTYGLSACHIYGLKSLALGGFQAVLSFDPGLHSRGTYVPLGVRKEVYVRKVLFVDNEMAMKLALDLIFRGRNDFQIIFAQNENEVFGCLTNNEIVLMVCDYNLGAQKGPDLIKKVKEKIPKLKTIVMSGENPEGIQRSCDAAGVNLILSKGELHKTLIPAINKILEE